MKYCPKCKREYINTLNFCTECGEPLIEKPIQAPAKVKPEPSQPPVKENPNEEPKKKRGSIWKKILIGLIIVVVAFFALGQYAMNAATYLRVEPNQVVSSKCGGQIKIDIDYDGYVWKINHKPDWVHIAEFENSFEITLARNTTGQNLEGSVTIQSGKQLAQLMVMQYGKATYLKASKTSLKYDKYGGTTTIEIDTDGGDWEVANAPSYIDAEKVDNATLKVKVPRNKETSRSGNIVLKEDGVSAIISFSQGGKCASCNGTGKQTCGVCWGTGSTSFGFYTSLCSYCGGSGQINCVACGGTGEN